MANHHHKHHNSSSPNTHSRHVPVTVSRSWLLRILSVLLLLLPAIFYLLSLSFSLASMFNENFALSYRLVDNAVVFNNSLAYKSSPFFHCTAVNDESIANGRGFNQTCDKLGTNAMGAKGVAACRAANFDDAQGCAQRVLAAELIVSGAILAAFALVLAMVGLAVGWSKAFAATTTVDVNGTSAESAGLMRSSEEEGDGKEPVSSASAVPSNGNVNTSPSILSSFVSACATLLAIIAAVLLVVGQSIAYNALVIVQSPTLNEGQGSQTRWVFGKAAQLYLTLSYCFAAIGVLIVWSRLGLSDH